MTAALTVPVRRPNHLRLVTPDYVAPTPHEILLSDQQLADLFDEARRVEVNFPNNHILVWHRVLQVLANLHTIAADQDTDAGHYLTRWREVRDYLTSAEDGDPTTATL